MKDASRARVERVVAAGFRVWTPSDPLHDEALARLPETTGLDPAGIRLALRCCLEVHPMEADMAALLARTGRAPRCHVVLSANVFTAPLRALALAAATSPSVVVRPSRRDPVIAELLVRALQADELFHALGATIELVDVIAPCPGEELHIYGSDATIRMISNDIPTGVVIRGHGTGLGLAIVGAEVSLSSAAGELARDVTLFDQRGCLSPRFALVEGDAARAEEFARALDEALSEAVTRWAPRGRVDDATAAEIALYGTTMEAVGSFIARSSHAIGVDTSPRALVLPPAARVVHVVATGANDAPRLIAPWIDYVTVVGTNDDGALTRAVLACAPHARRSPLGGMQHPPLDGPVDLRPPRA